MKFCYPVATPDCPGPLMALCGDFDKNLSILRNYGYTGIELLVKNVKNLNIGDIMRSVEKNQLEIAALATSPLPTEEKLCLASNEPQVREEAFSRALDIAHLAKELKVPVVVGRFRGLVDEENKDNNWDVLKEKLIKLCQAAAPTGIIAMEIQQPGLVNTFNCTDEALRRCDEIGIDNLKLLPDTFHQDIVDESICSGLFKMKEKIAFVHLSDSERLVPGFGTIPFREVLSMYKAIDYKGYLSMEVKQKPDGITSARLCIESITYINSIGCFR